MKTWMAYDFDDGRMAEWHPQKQRIVAEIDIVVRYFERELRTDSLALSHGIFRD